MLKKAKRWQLVKTNFEFQELAETQKLRLFKQSKSNSHSLNHLYKISSNERVGTSCQRGHNFVTQIHADIDEFHCKMPPCI